MASFRDLLLPLAEADFRDFAKRTIPCECEILGIRIPLIRKLVKAIPIEDFSDYLNRETRSLEEVLARGFLIAKLPSEEMVAYFDSQIERLDNWCAVDTFCAALRKSIKKNEAEFLKSKVTPLLDSSQEYVTRAGLVFLLDFYVDEAYLPVIFSEALRLGNRQEYYVKMALAWLLAECYAKYPEISLVFLKKNQRNIDPWTLNKTISKIHDSYRISDKMKLEAKKLRVRQ